MEQSNRFTLSGISRKIKNRPSKITNPRRKTNKSQEEEKEEACIDGSYFQDSWKGKFSRQGPSELKLDQHAQSYRWLSRLI